MKIIKKCLLGITAVGLTMSLSACGNKNDNEGNITVSNALNSKEMLPIVVTNSKDESEKNHVVWAGYIGQGKVKAMLLEDTYYNYGYKDLKKLNNKDYNDSLKDMGKDYFDGKFPRNYVTSKADTILKTNYKSSDNDDNKTEAVSLDFLNNSSKPEYSSVKDVVNGATYSHITKKKKDDEWATIKSEDSEEDSDYSGYEMHIKLGKDPRSNFKLEDAKKATKDYDNVKIDDEDYS